MERLKRIGVLSLAYNLTLFYFILGFIIALLILLLKKIPQIAFVIANTNPALLQLDGKALLIFPLGYAVLGFISGIFISLVYNLIAKVTGGIKIKLVGNKKK